MLATQMRSPRIPEVRPSRDLVHRSGRCPHRVWSLLGTSGRATALVAGTRCVPSLVHAGDEQHLGEEPLGVRRVGFANSISLQIRKIGADSRIYAPYGRLT